MPFINLETIESSDSFSEVINGAKKLVNHNGKKLEILGDHVYKLKAGKKEEILDAIEKAKALKDTKMEELKEKQTMLKENLRMKAQMQKMREQMNRMFDSFGMFEEDDDEECYLY